MVNLLSEQELYQIGKSIETVLSNENRYCSHFKIVINNKFLVNTLLNERVVLNIISIKLVKQLNIKELKFTQCNYITTNGKWSKTLSITQNITIQLFNKELKIAAIIYNHIVFPFLLKRRTLKKFKILTDWEIYNWIMKTNYGI